MSGRAPRHWGIVGGGMLGLTLALRLARRGERVTVLEAAPQLGGLASAWTLGDVVWDRHYHVILPGDQRLRALLAELGLESEIRWRQTRTGFFSGGRWYSLSNAFEFLRFPPLGLIDKLRLGLTVLWAARRRDGRALEALLATDWLRRWSGDGTTDKIWIPLLRAKLGDNYARVSASFIWAIIKRMYGARGRGGRKETMGHVAGGYGRILERFAEVLRQSGVEIRLGCRVESVRGRYPRVEVKLEGDESILFDAAVVTAPAPIAAGLCPDLLPAETERLRGVEYQGIVCASVLCRKAVSSFYVTNVTDAWVPFTGVIEMTALVDKSQFGGHSLLYLPRYAAQDDPIWSSSDEEIEQTFLSALERMAPHFDRRDVLCFRLSRARHVMPLPTLYYSARLPPMRTSVPGLFTVSSAQIVNATLNANETVELAEKSLEVLCP